MLARPRARLAPDSTSSAADSGASRPNGAEPISSSRSASSSARLWHDEDHEHGGYRRSERGELEHGHRRHRHGVVDRAVQGDQCGGGVHRLGRRDPPSLVGVQPDGGTRGDTRHRREPGDPRRQQDPVASKCQPGQRQGAANPSPTVLTGPVALEEYPLQSGRLTGQRAHTVGGQHTQQRGEPGLLDLAGGSPLPHHEVVQAVRGRKVRSCADHGADVGARQVAQLREAAGVDDPAAADDRDPVGQRLRVAEDVAAERDRPTRIAEPERTRGTGYPSAGRGLLSARRAAAASRCSTER